MNQTSKIDIIRTNAENDDFRKLAKKLDADLKIRDGEDHAFYAQFNKADMIKQVLVGYDAAGVAIACGAFKTYRQDTAEIKRMYVQLQNRGQGIASQVLQELEKWAKELSYKKCILETGINQPEAIRLYQKNGYQMIPNFGQYENMTNSICFEKILGE